MNIAKTFLAVSSSLTVATPALAHDGDHSIGFASTALHWLSSSSHSLFAVIGGIVASVLIFKLARKGKTHVE